MGARAGRIAEGMQVGARAGRIAEGMQMGARAGASLRECRWDARGGHIDGSIRCLSMVSFLRNKGCISCI